MAIQCRRCFNPRPPCGERRRNPATSKPSTRFNPRPPCGERRQPSKPSTGSRRFNPRPPCGERHHRFRWLNWDESVSIHAPRAGSDGRLGRWHRRNRVSIHAPRAGSDRRLPTVLALADRFQSTPPVRGATALDLCRHKRDRVSIHAPRAGSDRRSRPSSKPQFGFNPRPPCGERPHHCNCLWSKGELVCLRECHAPATATLSLRGLRCRYHLQIREFPSARTPW